MAKRVISSKDPKLALTLLEEHDRFLRMQIEEIDRQIARGGDHKGVLSEERRNLELAAEAAGSDGMLETKFVLLGMEELVPGALWKGSKEQIEAAIEHANKGSQKPTVSYDKETGRWKITVGERTYEIHQVVSSAKTVDAQRVVLAGNDQDLRNAAKLIPSEKGTLNVFVHGTVDDFVVTLDGRNVTIDHRRLGNYIKSKGIDYERVKLFACSSGKHPKGAAQHLANKLGVPVLAPSDYLFIHPDGTVTIGPSQDRNTGHWEEFNPQKSESRYQKSADPQKPAASAPSETKPAQKKAKSLSGDDGDEYDETMDGLRGHSDRSYDNVSEGAYGDKDSPEVAAVQPRNRAIVGTVDNPGDVQSMSITSFLRSSVIASGLQTAGSIFTIS